MLRGNLEETIEDENVQDRWHADPLQVLSPADFAAQVAVFCVACTGEDAVAQRSGQDSVSGFPQISGRWLVRLCRQSLCLPKKHELEPVLDEAGRHTPDTFSI